MELRSDYEYYVEICNKCKTSPLEERDDWFRHLKQLENQLDLKEYDILNNNKDGE